MNIINSVIILASIMMSILLVFNTTTTIPMMINVFAESEGEYEKEEQSYDYPPERESGYPSMMNDYYAQGPPPMMAERGEYDPDRYGGYYGHYEGDFYLDQYDDGNPYDGIDGPYNGNDDDNPYDDGNGSPYILG